MNRQYLLQCFRYDPKRGLLSWRERPREHFATDRGWRCFNSRDADRLVGSRQVSGYLTVRLDGKLLYVHRIIWTMENPAPLSPGSLIDHINGDRADNRIANLRVVTHKENAWNNAGRPARVLPKGVFYDKERGNYRVYVSRNKKQTVRRFASIEAAIAAVRAIREEMHGEFANHGGGNAASA